MKKINPMIDGLRQLAVFAKTVECGSFRQAALELQLSPSVVSYHVSRLELSLNTALLYRTTRNLSLTNEGEKVFASAQRMLAEAQNSFDILNSQEVKGKLTITIPALMVHHPLFKKISRFAHENKLVTLNIKVTDQRINLIEHGIDLAIRIGKLEDNQASLKQKKITQINRILVAGRKLLEANKPPNSPEDIENWPWVGLTMLPYHRSMTNLEGKQIKIAFQPSIFVDSVDAMTELAKEGVGLATAPDYLIEEALLSGEVMALLPKWKINPIEVFVVWPIHTRKNSLSYLLIDFLQGQN